MIPWLDPSDPPAWTESSRGSAAESTEVVGFAAQILGLSPISWCRYSDRNDAETSLRHRLDMRSLGSFRLNAVENA